MVTTRRRWVVGLLVGLGALAAPLTARLWPAHRRPRARSPFVGLLARDRFPRWHADASGLNPGDAVCVRRPVAPGQRAEIRLEGTDARLWCRCAGVYSERQLAEQLAAELGLEASEAGERVRAFLTPLYHDGFLVRATTPPRSDAQRFEREATLSEGRTEWERTTA